MGSFINQLSEPFGVKLFSGGPYADRQLGDQALGQAGLLSTQGQQLFGQGQNALNTGLGGFQNAVNQYSGLAGIQSPFSSTASKAYGSPQEAHAAQLNQPVGGMEQGPFGLTGPFLLAYNNQAAQINQQRQEALHHAQAMAGNAPGATLVAAQQYINSHHDNLLNELGATMAQNAFQSKLGAAQYDVGAALNQANLGSNLIGQGAGMIGGAGNTYQQQAQAAQQRTQGANQFIQGLTGYGLGQIFGPKTPQTASPETQSQAAGGAIGGIGGVGPGSFYQAPWNYEFGPSGPQPIQPPSNYQLGGYGGAPLFSVGQGPQLSTAPGLFGATTRKAKT